eukprot:CAMPEP_0198579670 /NCGR_PEP_ID=MMETSP1462-20131121/121835_1 /TAXON_ID=1333877 /ORGANISM="Brandtodinium nutriculum, Strain RCC3387" /LENGTH=645 /DNA_ID=CAMNT_0044310999 /DNA_START=22 /DNA_END=1955 /DNA_ORIENTATION=-
MRMWLEAAGWKNLLLFCGIVFAQRTLFLIESLVLATWVDAKISSDVNDSRYICMLVLVVSMCCGSFILLYWAAGRLSFAASQHIHDRMLRALLRAPVDRFFDKQPVGRLINRFSFDLRFVDNAISFCVLMLAAFVFGFIITQGYVLSIVPWSVALFAMPFYGLVLFYACLYRGAATPLIFHSKLALSCIQDLQGMVMSSCVSIRANGMRTAFMARHNHYSAAIIRCQYLIFHVAKAWVLSRVTLCFASLTIVLILGGLWTGVPMGTLANVISLSFLLMSEFEMVFQMFANFITCLNSVQRLARIMNVTQEAADEQPADPCLRMSVHVDRSELAALEMRGGVQAEASLPDCANPQTSWLYFAAGGQRTSLAVFLKGRFPVLRAAQDGRALELLDGRRLRDLAPGSAALRGNEENYSIVAVNGCARNASQMASELCNPPAGVWLDLWHGQYTLGMRVQVEDLTAGYSGEPGVLRGLCIDIPARGRLGLVGRSGCGKSTALLCMLRILEARSGRILIGGLDASKLGLAALRAMCGIVPQDAAVFEGSWRQNLDPLGGRPDAVLWDALQSTALMPCVRALPGGLDAEIARDGANLSSGQRQLLGLARMVVRQPPVLLLDECAPSVDPRAQDVVRSCLAAEFPMSTVLAA